MKPIGGDTCRRSFPAAVHPLIMGISGVVLCAGCATDTTVGLIRSGGRGAVDLARIEPGAVAVAAAPAPAIFRFEPAEGQLDSQGRRAGEAAAGVLAVPALGDPLLDAVVSPLAVAVSPFVAAYGAMAAKQTLPPHKYSETEAELAQAMSAMSDQEHLRKWFLASAAEQTRLTVAAAETFRTNDPGSSPSAIVETRVEELRLERKGRTDKSYALRIKTRARVLRAFDGAVLYDQPFEYESKQALFLDWARGDGLASVAQTGFRALAEEMVQSTLCAPREQVMFTGVGYRNAARRPPPPAGASVAQFVEVVTTGGQQPTAAHAHAVEASMGPLSAGLYPISDDSFSVFSTRSAPGMTFQEPLSREQAGPETVADTEHFLDTMQDFPNAVVQVAACAAALPVGLWQQGMAVARSVPQKRIDAATAALRRAALETRPDLELANHVAGSLGLRSTEPALLVSEGARPPARRHANRTPETALEIHVRKAGLTGGEGLNPKVALELELQVRLFRTADGRDICSYPVHYRSETHHYTSWAANNAQLFRQAWARCYADVSKSIMHHFVSQGLVAPQRRPTPILVQN